MTFHIHVPKKRRQPKIEVQWRPEDRSYRVAFIVDGRLISQNRFADAYTFARLLRTHAAKANAGVNDDVRLIAETRGQVKAANGKVVLSVDLGDVAELDPQEAELLAVAVQEAADIARVACFEDVDKHFTGGARVKCLFSWEMPTVHGMQDLERVGDLRAH